MEAFPTIEKNLSALTDDFGATVKKGIEANENSLREQREWRNKIANNARLNGK